MTRKEQHEKAVGDAFFDEFNRRNGTDYRFAGRPPVSPDGIYRDRDRELLVEVSTSYYGNEHARTLWTKSKERHGGKVDDPDRLLAEFLNTELIDKCGKDYGSNCILLLAVAPTITTAEEMDLLVPDLDIPARPPFVAIYIVGIFGTTTGDHGGHRSWMIYPDRLRMDAASNISCSPMEAP